MAKRAAAGKRRSSGTGRFIYCPASGPRHSHGELLACEVQRGPSGKYFVLCRECMTRVFLNTWQDEFGYTLLEVEEARARVVGLPPARRAQLVRELAEQAAAVQAAAKRRAVPPRSRV